MVLFKYVGRFDRRLERWREGDVTEQHTMEQLNCKRFGSTQLMRVRSCIVHSPEVRDCGAMPGVKATVFVGIS